MKSATTFHTYSELLNTITSPIKHYDDLNILINNIGDAKYVLLGEASHGTHEYYTWRAKISKRLIEEKGFSFIAVEGDWPDCYRLNRYVKNYPNAGENAQTVLQKFNRWPTWMWANWEIVAFSEWLKKHNQSLTSSPKVGFYGLDVYSLWESMEAIVAYLEKNDPNTLQTAIHTMQCFEPYRAKEGQSYANASRLVPKLCEKEVVNLLREIQRHIPTYNTDHEQVLSTAQNAVVAVNAEKYYRAMVKGGPLSWNIRDNHMVDTLDRLMTFHGKDSKAIIWEHNTHIGNAKATSMHKDGMVNVGQLVREKHHQDGVVLVGFGSYQGSVIAGRAWGDVMRKMTMPPAVVGSWEQVLHRLYPESNILINFKNAAMEPLLQKPIGHRAIGVVYHPEYEEFGNYVPSQMGNRYDSFLFFDRSSALHPLHIEPDGHQIPETFPFGF
jgi:erythromycin esterase